MTAIPMRSRVAFDLRLAWRLHRFELVGFGVLVAFLAAAAVGVAGLLDATGYGASCDPLGGNPPACEAMGREFYDLQASLVSPVQSLLMGVPFLVGAALGAPLVARELERGTVRLAWSLAPSRVRWFVVRLLPVLGAVFVLALVAGLALDRILASTEPGMDVTMSFAAYGSRGIVLAARVTFVFAVGVAVGALTGRVLPALILTAVVAWIGLSGGMSVHGQILASEAVQVDDATGSGVLGAMYFDQRIRMPDGRVVTWDELSAIVPPEEDGSEWPPAGYSYVSLVVPGDRYPSVQAREVAALAGGSLVAFAIAGATVRRRRPG